MCVCVCVWGKDCVSPSQTSTLRHTAPVADKHVHPTQMHLKYVLSHTMCAPHYQSILHEGVVIALEPWSQYSVVSGNAADSFWRFQVKD